jgi:hypothetical protein
MKPFYYISFNSRDLWAIKYKTLKSAVEAAEEMAADHAGTSIEILKCMAISSSPKPHVTTFYLDRATE